MNIVAADAASARASVVDHFDTTNEDLVGSNLVGLAATNTACPTAD
jgi:hypothetical protein